MIDELKERDEELVRVVAHSSELEASFKAREDEVKLRKGLTAENDDLQARVADLTAKLSAKVAEIEGLKGKIGICAD